MPPRKNIPYLHYPMQPRTYIPAPALRPYIQRYLLLESEVLTVNRVLPNTALVLCFRYRGNVHFLEQDALHPLPAAVFTGLRQSVRFIRYAPDTANFLVQFTPTGAAAFSKTPLHETFNESIALDALLYTASLEEQLMEAVNDAARVQCADEYFLRQLKHPGTDALVQAAVQRIKQNDGHLKMKALAAELYISQDAFEKRFRRVVGASPKQYAGIVRMHHIIAQGAKSLVGAAFEAGYADQPHFNKDFKRFTGQAPLAFFKDPLYW